MKQLVTVAHARVLDVEPGDLVRIEAALAPGFWRRVLSVETVQAGDAVLLKHGDAIRPDADPVNVQTDTLLPYALLEVQVTAENRP